MKAGEKIKFLRKAQGITQSELAKKIGTTQAHLSDIERGIKGFSESMALKIATAFKVSLTEIIKDSEPLGHEFFVKMTIYNQAISYRADLRKAVDELKWLGDFLKEMDSNYEKYYLEPKHSFINSIEIESTIDFDKFINQNKSYFDRLIAVSKAFSSATNGIGESLAFSQSQLSVDK